MTCNVIRVRRIFVILRAQRTVSIIEQNMLSGLLLLGHQCFERRVEDSNTVGDFFFLGGREGRDHDGAGRAEVLKDLVDEGVHV